MKINELKNIINKYNIHIKKQYGQNFLLDDNILNNIIKYSELEQYDGIIEIGPGLGFLTEKLIHHDKPVLSYEIDPIMKMVTEDRLGNVNNLEVILGDFLKRDIEADIKKCFDSSNIIVIANLPYYITTPILFKILEEVSSIKKMVVMMQKEVALRICSKPSTKDYNSLSVLTDYLTTRKILFNVKPQCFFPEPAVESSVVEIVVGNERCINPLDKSYFYRFNRIIFSQRRKTLANNIVRELNIDKETVESILQEMNLPLNVRAETLNTDQIIAIANQFYLKTC